jgi:glycosyltransferase involved in cell wall biosynthesis
MNVFSYYPADPRPRREAEALVEAGFEVDVVCLRDEGQSPEETIAGVRALRLPVRRIRGGKLRYLWQYLAFLVLSFFRLAGLHHRRRYDAIHVHNMPDFLVFGALVPRLSGARIVLDLHDPMPEVYMAKYDLPAAHPVIRALRWIEKLSIAFADLVLTPNLAFKEIFVARSCPEEKVRVIMNSPQESVFRPAAESDSGIPNDASARPEAPFVVMFHGTVVERHGLDTALAALDRLRDRLPRLVLHVYGEGDFVPRFRELVGELGLDDRVRYFGHVPLETIAAAIPAADVGLIPNKRSPFTEINMPTRIFEYLCYRKPVIVPRTRGIRDYFGEDDIVFFEGGDADGLAEVILRIHDDPDLRERVVRRGLAVYERHRWAQEKLRLVEEVRGLITGGR